MKSWRSGDSGHSYSAIFLGLLAAGLGLSIIVAWVASSYFQIDVAGSLVWPGSDGFCDGPTQAVGVHCFSDLALHLTVGTTLVPDDPGLVQYVSNLPPGNRLLLWVFQLLASGIGFRVTFLIYLALSAAALLVPGLWAVRSQPWPRALVTILLISVATVPFLAVLDRGNTIAFTVPLILLFVIGLWRGNDVLAVTALILVAQLKPQFGLLVIGFFVLRRFKAGVIAVAGAGLVFLGSFLIFAIPGAGSSPLEEFKKFVLYSQVRGDYVPLDAAYPVNISFQKIIFAISDTAFGATLSQSALQTITVGIVGLVLVALLWRGKSLPYPVWIAVVLLSGALIVSVTFIYYFSAVLVIAAVLMRADEFGPPPASRRFLYGGLLVATVLSLTPLLVPAGSTTAPVPSFGEGVVISLLPYIASLAWLVLTITVGVAAVRNRREPEPVEQ